MKASSLAIATAVILAAVPASPAGVILHSGDLVISDSFFFPEPEPRVWRVDPVTFDTTRIATDGLLDLPMRIAVDGAGTVFVADHDAGIVAIDPPTGAQTLVASIAALGGGTPSGICADPTGGIDCTVISGGTGAVVHVGGAIPAPRIVSEGGQFVMPTCVTIGPDGALYVGDWGVQAVAQGAAGGIFRVERSGQQTLVASGSPFYHPFDIAITPDGWIWTAQQGGLTRRGGGFRRTRMSDGFTEVADGDRSQALATAPDGSLYLGDCISVSLDCYSGYRFVTRYPSLDREFVPVGAMAVVPDLATPAHKTSWGSLKSVYR